MIQTQTILRQLFPSSADRVQMLRYLNVVVVVVVVVVAVVVVVVVVRLLQRLHCIYLLKKLASAYP